MTWNDKVSGRWFPGAEIRVNCISQNSLLGVVEDLCRSLGVSGDDDNKDILYAPYFHTTKYLPICSDSQGWFLGRLPRITQGQTTLKEQM
jgi:hypothetical protein